MISIGADHGGPEQLPFYKELGDFMRFCKENRARGFQGVMINIVYHVPGTLLKPDYVGVRTGKFSRKERCLMVQVAVEEEFAALDDAKKIRQYIFETADEALGIAKSFLDRKGINYEIETDRATLDEWLAESANC